MGSRLEKVRQNVENASRIEQKGVEQGERDASEVREIKSIIEGMTGMWMTTSWRRWRRPEKRQRARGRII